MIADENLLPFDGVPQELGNQTLRLGPFLVVG